MVGLFSEESERAVLGIIVARPENVHLCIEARLSAEHFYVPSHRTVYEAITSLAARGIQADLLAINRELKVTGQLDKLGGPSFVEHLLSDYVGAYSLSYHIRQMLDCYKRRTLNELGQYIAEKSKEAEDPDQLAASCVSQLTDLLEKEETHTPSALLARARQEWENAAQGKYEGLPSKWYAFGNLLGHYRDGELYILGARPSCGKTAILCEEAVYAAKAGYKIAIASLEMSEDALRRRMACSLANISLFKLMRGQSTKEEREYALQCYAEINRLPIYIYDRRATMNELESWVVGLYHRKGGVDILWVDYLTLIKQSAKSEDDWYRVVGEWAARFKEIAKRLKIPVVVLSQFSRAGVKLEQRATPPPPTLESLRDSGEIEQHADGVLLVYKRPGISPETFDQTTSWPMEWHLAKNRNGPTGKLPMIFHRHVQQYEVDLSVFDNAAQETRRAKKSENYVDDDL